MAGPENSSSLLLRIGGAILAAGAAALGGFWIYAITTAEDVPTLVLAAFIAVLVGVAVLLAAAIRDRVISKRQENFLEVDH